MFADLEERARGCRSQDCQHVGEPGDEAPLDSILGSHTLQDLIKRVKKDLPALHLWDEVGGGDETMLCELITEQGDRSSGGAATILRLALEDGREAVVVTIGTPEAVARPRPTVVQRCLARGDSQSSVPLTDLHRSVGRGARR